MNKLLLIISAFLLLSCNGRKTCDNPVKGRAMLVAYRVAKHSHVWLQDVKTDSIYEVSGLGGRREPIAKLGDVIDVTYCGNEIVSEIPVQYPDNTDTRFVFLTGYNYLLD